MVSVKALLALYAILGAVHSYPIHRPVEDSAESQLTTRSPSPRFKNPFDVDSYLNNLDYEIPSNKDIQEWVKEARKKGALAAEGNFSGDGDEDEDDEGDHDDDHDDDDEDHKTKATPTVSGKDDDDDDHEDDHSHDQHTTQSGSRPDGEQDDDDDDGDVDDDAEDDAEDDDEDDDDKVNKNEAAQSIQSAQPARPTITMSSTAIATATTTNSNSAVPTSIPNHEGDEEDNIEILQPVQSAHPPQPTSTREPSAPTITPSSTALSADAPNPGVSDETDEDETNQVMPPNDTSDLATTTIPFNTISGGDDTAPAVQTVYVPVNIFPTPFPYFPDIDDDEKPSPSSTPVPIFPPPEVITKANLPPAAVPSSEGNANTNDPEVSGTPVAEDIPTTPDVASIPNGADAPMNEEQPGDSTDSTISIPEPIPQMPSHEAQLSQVSELLDMITSKDQSEESY